MTDPLEPRALPSRRFLPGTDPWRDRFLLELRVRDVPGDRIGDALAQIDAHCAESGEAPSEAFGPPQDYARDLAGSLVTARPSRARTAWWSYGLLGGAMFSGILLLLAGFDAVVHDEDASLGAGALGALVVMSLACCAVEPGLRLLHGRRRFPVLFVVLFALFMLQMLMQTWWQGSALTLPAWPALLVGAALSVAALVHVTRVTPDRVIDPRTGREAFTPPRGAMLVAALLLPVTLVIAIGLLVILPSPR